MNISHFKLINDGFVGIEVEAIESILQTTPTGTITIQDKVSRKRPYPIPDFIREKVQKLKYFYLNLTSHWVAPFNKFFDMEKYEIIELPKDIEVPKGFLLLQSIMNHTKITGVTVRDAGFCITGTIETVENKKIGISTPFVTEEDDVSFYIEAMDKINDIIHDISKLLRSTTAIEFNGPSVARAIGIKSESTKDLSKQELIDLVINGLQDRGAIILESGISNADVIESSEEKTTLHTGNGSIDSHNMPEANIQKEGVEENEDEKASITKTPEKKNIGKGTLVSDKKFPILDDRPVYVQHRDSAKVPEGGSLEDYEHSENLGIPREEPLLETIEDEDNGDDNPDSIQNQKTDW